MGLMERNNYAGEPQTWGGSHTPRDGGVADPKKRKLAPSQSNMC